MASTNYDLVIAGYKARIAQSEEGGGYKRRTVRREIQSQLITQADNPSQRNRDDGVATYQSSWAGGARWWKPLMAEDQTAYFRSNHMDLWSEPGKILPGNAHVDAANTDIHDNCVIATDGTTIYAIGNTTSTDATMRDVYTWAPGSNAFSRATAYSSGIQDDSEPVSMVYDSTDGYFYVLAQTNAGAIEIGRFNPVTNDDTVSWETDTGTLGYGASIVTSPYGLFYTGGTSVKEISKTPAITEVFDPATKEFLVRSNTNVVAQSPLLVSTPQGMYLVRNTLDAGLPIATIYRIDRDAAGVFFGNPIATLPLGTLALSVQFHLGQLYIAATPDWRDMADGEEHLEIVVYFVGEGGMGAFGSVLGGRSEKDETPYCFLGAEGERVYLAGSKRLWVYDAIRGGLHSAWEWETPQADGGYKAMARSQDSSGHEIQMFLAKDRINTVKVGDQTAPDTVSAFGDDLTHYTLESVFFDGGLPMESKEITEVAILRDKDSLDNSRWSVYVSADEGSWTAVLESNTAGIFDHKVLATPISGYQFRYKVVYQTKTAVRSALRAILVTMTSGDMVTEWDVVLDGSELINVDNERQDPETFVTQMQTLAATASVTSLIDNYVFERDESTSVNVKVAGVEIVKSTPGESLVRVLLREA